MIKPCREAYIRQLYNEYAKSGIETYQMKPNQNEVNVLNKGIGIT